MHVCYIPTLSILTGLLFSHMDDILQNSYTQCRLKEANMCLCVRKKLKYELSTLIMFIEGKKITFENEEILNILKFFQEIKDNNEKYPFGWGKIMFLMSFQGRLSKVMRAN